MKRRSLSLLLACGLTVMGLANGSSRLPAEPPTTMAPFSVRGDSLDFDVNCNRTTLQVYEIKVTSVAPGTDAYKLGIRAGDHVVSINKRPVSSFTHADFSGGNDAMTGAEVAFQGRRVLGLYKFTAHVTIAEKPLLPVQLPEGPKPGSKSP